MPVWKVSEHRQKRAFSLSELGLRATRPRHWVAVEAMRNDKSACGKWEFPQALAVLKNS